MGLFIMQKGVICMAEKYVARYGKVWKKRSDNEILTDTIELKAGENIRNYTQVDKPKKTEETKKIEETEPQKTKAKTIFGEEVK